MIQGPDILARCDQLAAISESPEHLTRTFLTPAHMKANELVAGWMRAAGLVASVDAVGNIIGRYEGGNADARCLLLGSHLDTVRNAGKYDGMLGVVSAIACISRLRDENIRPLTRSR